MMHSCEVPQYIYEVAAHGLRHVLSGGAQV